jgi:hypothetical protein
MEMSEMTRNTMKPINGNKHGFLADFSIAVEWHETI